MALFARTAAPRVPHHEPGFNEVGYVAEYSEATRKHAAAEHRQLLDFIAARIVHGQALDVLDIGCGPGWIAIRLAQMHPGLRVTGIDVSPEFLALANENKLREGVAKQIEFVAGDAGCLNRFASQSFDAVISNQSLHYWESPPTAFDEIARVLRPGGHFCISDDRRDMTRLGRLQVSLARWFIPGRIGSSWRRSLDGCFSSQEVAQMLQSSALKDRWTMTLSAHGLLITGR